MHPGGTGTSVRRMCLLRKTGETYGILGKSILRNPKRNVPEKGAFLFSIIF